MLTLYGTAASRAFRPLWLLEELGEPFEHKKVGPHSAEVRAISPLGKIPVLEDAGAVIPDSSAILLYLADKYGRFTAPAGTVARAQQDAMLFRVLDELDALLWTAARHSFVLPEDQRVPAVKDSLKVEFARNLARITDEIAGPFVMGDEMTVVDIVLCHCGGWAKLAQFPDAPPAFVEYMRALRARPAYERAAAARA